MRKAMMNRKRLQLDVCRAILENNGRCRACKITDTEIAITIDGYSAYVFDVKECVFDINKIPEAEGIKTLLLPTEEDTEIVPSCELYNLNGKMVQKYTGEKFEIFIDTKILRDFKDFGLYASNPQSRVLVTDNFNRVIGVVLPVRFNVEDVKRRETK